MTGPRRETVFMRVCELEYEKLFDSLIDMLVAVAEDRTKDLAARDITAARAKQQSFLFKMIARPNRGLQNAMSKAIIKDRPRFCATLLGLMKNENLVITTKDEKGQTIENEVVVSKASPAPHNPVLSLLLMQDSRGNTVFHTATVLNREDCLRKLFTGLSFMDSYMIIARIPNNYGLTVKDLLDANATQAKLQVAMQAGKAKPEEAKQMLAMSRKVSRDVRAFLDEMIKRSEDIFERTGGLSEAKPTFDLKRIPSVVEQLKIHGKI